MSRLVFTTVVLFDFRSFNGLCLSTTFCVFHHTTTKSNLERDATKPVFGVSEKSETQTSVLASIVKFRS